MMHANKMILVPHEIVGDSDSTTKFMSNLDKEMLKILEDKTIPIDAKIMHYNQVLRMYQTVKHDAEKPFQLEMIQEPIPEIPPTPHTDSPKKTAIDDNVINTVPKKWRNQAAMLLTYAQQNPHLKWSDKGEMIVDGNKVVGSNIVDLINDFSRTRKTEPVIGADIFLKKLIEENVPKESIVNKHRLSLLNSNIFVASSPQLDSSSASSTPMKTPKSQSIGHRVKKWAGIGGL